MYNIFFLFGTNSKSNRSYKITTRKAIHAKNIKQNKIALIEKNGKSYEKVNPKKYCKTYC